MYPSVWNTLSRLRQAREPLAWWKHYLGPGFDALRSFLVPCEGLAGKSYPCPDSGVRLTVRETGGRYVAFPTGDAAEDAEDRELTWNDVQAWQLNHEAWRMGVASALGLAPAPADGRPGEMELAGFCGQGRERKRVYLCHAVGGDASARVAADGTLTPDAGCVLFAERQAGAEKVLMARGIALVALAECLTLEGGGLTGGCGELCRTIRPDITNVELKNHLDRRLDTVGTRVSELELENTKLKQDLSQVLANLARQVEPEFFQWIFVILAAGSVNAAAQILGVPGSTFAGKLKEYMGRGGLYATLYSLVGIRNKGAGRKRIVRFNELFAEHQGKQGVAEPDVLRELLDGLEELNGANWKAMRKELIGIVKSEFPED